MDTEPEHYESEKPTSDPRTRSERFLHAVAGRTFLSLWSYPNPFRDPSSPKDLPKEICDLLVVFGNDVLLFSDKEIDFPRNTSLEAAWVRWYRKAVAASAKQLFGAERWLRENPDRIFTDRRCTQPFPINLPPKDKMRVHRIIVARGASAPCKYLMGGMGTLAQSSRQAEESDFPFLCPQPDVTRGYVHVWDDVSLELLLDHLDTTADLVRYLNERERIVREYDSFMVTGEEEALAFYLSNINRAGEHYFTFKRMRPRRRGLRPSSVFLDEGFWAGFVETEGYRHWRTESVRSRAWDELVQKFITHHVDGTGESFGEPELGEREVMYRTLATPTRLQRRMMVDGLFHMGTDERLKTGEIDMRRSILHPLAGDGPCFVFLILRHDRSLSSEEYKERRRTMLQALVFSAMDAYKLGNVFVGLAMNPAFDDIGSEDAMYVDRRTCTPDTAKLGRDLRKMLGAFQTKREQISVTEFARNPRLPPPKPSLKHPASFHLK